jgi:hypothetical protein
MNRVVILNLQRFYSRRQNYCLFMKHKDYFSSCSFRFLRILAESSLNSAICSARKALFVLTVDQYNFLSKIIILKKSFFLFFHSLREKNPNATAQEIEHILDGNMCRCTGYRSIHDAFKSFATDASDSIKVHPYII